jgi:hypothetical protein
MGFLAVLRHGEEGVHKLGSEGFKFGGAFGRGGKLVLFANEPVAIGLNRAGGEMAVDEVGRLAIKSETGGTGRSEQRTAVPSPNADVVFVHGESHDFEAAVAEVGEETDLLWR